MTAIKDRSRLTTEKRNPRTAAIDALPTLAIVNLINAEDRRVAPAVAKQRKAIARAVDIIVDRFRAGGRLFYVGAGTSGRLGVLDASECPPTFGVPRTLVQGVIAAADAPRRSIEGAEDSERDGPNRLQERSLPH